jgi:Zn-dependent membrane protease YugP
MFFDSTMILLIPALLLALWAQYLVKSTFAKYSKVPAERGMTGGEVAKRLLYEAGLHDVPIEKVSGKLTDHYDPRSRTLRLSDSIAGSRSVAAIGIAAHEVGHAIQHEKGYSPFNIRQSIFPVANIGSTLAFPMFFIGFLFSSFRMLMDVGNASSRALALLRDRAYLGEDEIVKAKKVLQAAAMTYVAATAMAVIHLVRLLILQSGRD